MKRFLTILFCGLVVLQTGALAAGWSAQSSGTTDVVVLNDVFYYSDASTSFAVTAGGADFFKTYDAGTTWVQKPTGFAGNISAVQFPSAQTGYMGGNTSGFASSPMKKTTDGGENWTAAITQPDAASGTHKGISDIYAVSDSVVYICGLGGASNDWCVAKTTDGGTTWTNTSTMPTAGTYNSIFFKDASNGWVVGPAGKIYYTNNGGTSWTSQASGLAIDLVSIFFLDSTTGWVLSKDGDVLKYSGSSWTSVRTGTADKVYTSIWFSNANNGWIVTKGGTILNSTNGGTTWTAQTSGTIRDLNAVYGISGADLWAVGGDAINPATIVKYSGDPTIISTIPSSMGAGAQNQTITITGTNFKDSTLAINTAGTTGITYSAARNGDVWTITISISNGFTPAAGTTVPITITAPGGGFASTNLQINPAPVISRVFRRNTKLGDVNWDRLGATNRTITLEGQYFQAGAAVTWSKGGSGAGITVSKFTNISANMETCVISADKNTSTLGIWEVKLTNPDQGVTTGAFSILTDSEGPVVDPFLIEGSATATILSNFNPYFNGTLTDAAHGMVTADANIKLLIDSNGNGNNYEYYYEPKNTDVFTSKSATAGDFKFTMGNVIDSSTGLPVDLFGKVGTAPWQAILYCEDAEGNPSWVTYPSILAPHTVAFPSTVTSGGGFIVYPNPRTNPNVPFDFQIDVGVGQASQNNKIRIYTINGDLIKTIEPINLNAGRNNVKWDGNSEVFRDASPGGGFLAILFDSSWARKRTCKIVNYYTTGF